MSATPVFPWRGLLLGLAGVTLFAATLPMTRVAVLEITWWRVWALRMALASIVSLVLVLVLRLPRPRRGQYRDMAFTMSGVVVGFPVLVTLAMREVPSGHGGIVIGLLPLATATIGVWLHQERQPIYFWVGAVTGAALVCAYSLGLGDNTATLYRGDLWLALAVIAGGFGYAAGASLTRALGGAAVICWANVLAAVVTVPVGLLALTGLEMGQLRPLAVGAVLYLGLVSQLAGFFLWYAGLARGGIGRISQTMLLMPFITLVLAWYLLDEPLSWYALGYCVAVAACVGVSVRLRRT